MDLVFMTIRIIVAILVPPLAVYLQLGIGRPFYLNILLTLLGYFPGLVHAMLVTLYSPKQSS